MKTLVAASLLIGVAFTSCSRDKPTNFEAAESAVIRHDLSALKIVVAADPSIVTQGSGFDGGTLLHKALVNIPSYECAEFLLASGADPDQADVTGEYPIHVICRFNGDVRCLKLLLDSGADPSTKWRGGMTPAQLARKWNFEEAASILDAATTNP